MLFNSYVFILALLPLSWIFYFLLNRFGLYRLAQVSLILASFVFYGYQEWRFCLLLLGTILINYGFHYLLVRMKEGPLKKALLVLAIILNLSLLFYFKYLNFALDTLNVFFGKGFVLKNIVMPLGISFFTFQQISMVVDSSRPGMVRYGFFDYALFVSFFPQLVAGPIVLHQEMIPQFQDTKKKKPDYGNLIAGIEYFILGFAKKVLVADFFAGICDAGYDKLGQLNSYSALLVILSFTLQIYFDFSGYCDMAKGIGKMFNIEIPINFNSPYKALTIADFWKRWHITLTRFLTQYLYIPLGGNQKGKWRTYLNIMIVFSLSGLWHGAYWTFIIWGILHGIMQVLCRVGKKVIERIPRWILWIGTFFFVNLAWTFFRADYFMQPFTLISKLFIGGGGWCQDDLLAVVCDNSFMIALLEKVVSPQILYLLKQIWIGILFVFWTGVCVIMPSTHEMIEKKQRSSGYYIYLSVLFIWSFIGLSQVSKFIYFNF